MAGIDGVLGAFPGNKLIHSALSTLLCPKATTVIDRMPDEVARTMSLSTVLTTATPSSQLAQNSSSMPVTVTNRPVAVTTTSRQSNSSSISTNSTLINGDVTSEKVHTSTNDLLSRHIVHGEPISVICSTLEKDRTVHSPVSVALAEGRPEQSTADSHKYCRAASPRHSDTYNATSNVDEPRKPTDNAHSGDIIGSLPKYNGPTPQTLSTIDHEPAENGSSTSTDSGVVTGSPKSDICATPPTVDIGE